jgi:hypothetical protein
MTRPKTQPTTVEAIIQSYDLSATARLILIFLSDLSPNDREQDTRSIERRTGLSHPTVAAALKALVESEKVFRNVAFALHSARPAALYSSLSTLGIPLGRQFRPQPATSPERAQEPTDGLPPGCSKVAGRDYQELI